MECTINQAVKLPFLSTNLTTGLTTFTYTLLVDGLLPTSAPTVTFTEVGGGQYLFNVTPNQTGEWTIFIQGLIQIRFTVVSRSTNAILRNLEDEALGSWTWNKTTGALTLLRQDGSSLGTFTMADTLDTASRERVS